MLQSENEPSLFNEPIIKRHKLQAFPIQHMDFDSDYMLELQNSIEVNDYDPNKPIIVCRSDNPAIDGRIVDGRHRLVCASRIEKRTKKPVNVTITHVEVADEVEAFCLQIKYEAEHLMRKNPKMAKEHIISLYEQMRGKLPPMKQQSMDAFIMEKG